MGHNIHDVKSCKVRPAFVHYADSDSNYKWCLDEDERENYSHIESLLEMFFPRHRATFSIQVTYSQPILARTLEDKECIG